MRSMLIPVVLVLTVAPLAWGQTNVGVGDVDEDGLVDRLVSIDRVLAVELGRVDGTFQRIGEVETGGSSTLWLADLDDDEHLDVVALVAPPGGSGGRFLGWTRGRGDGTFEPFAGLPMHLDGLLGADFDDLDGDGLADLVGVTFAFGAGFDMQLIVHRGLGGSGFAPAEVLGTAPAALTVEVADVSGDGRADLVLGRLDWPSTTHLEPLEIWLADPAGGFDAGPVFAPDGRRGLPLAHDLDRDGVLDLVVAGGTSVTGQVAVYQGLGGGSFGPGRVVGGLPAQQLFGARVGDLDGDGHVDLFVNHLIYGDTQLGNNQLEDEGLTVLRGRGDLTFERWQDLPGASGSLLHDADLDGDLDLVGPYLISNLGGGRLSETPSTPVGDRPTGLLADDVDGDGRADLIVIEESGSRVRILRGLPGARFELLGLLDPGFVVDVVRAGDLDSDGHLDLVLGGNQLVALRGDGTGQFGAAHVIDLDLQFDNVLLGDLRLEDVHGDGVLDILAVILTSFAGHGSTRLDIAPGQGDGTFGPPSTAFSSQLFVYDGGDLDGDGLFDIVALSMIGQQLRFGTFRGLGDGSFEQVSQLTPFLGGRILVADLDGDDAADLLTINQAFRRFYRGRGDGTLDPPVVSADLLLPLTALELADATDDGHLDLVYGFGQVVPGRGDGSFGDPLPFRAGAVPVATTLGDWNDDGTTDLAIANKGSDDVSIVLRGLAARWQDLGGALAGAAGEPRLVAGGSLVAGAPTTLILTRAAAGTDGYLIAGARLAGQPLAGGVLWPLPEVALPFVTDASGTWRATGRWPDGLPPGYQLHLQAWLVDPAGPSGLAASNGLTASVP